MESTTCSESASTAASHTSQRDREGIQGTQHGSTATMVEPNGEAFGGRAAQELAAGQQMSGMTKMCQEAQQSSTRPEEGELEFEMGWSVKEHNRRVWRVKLTPGKCHFFF